MFTFSATVVRVVDGDTMDLLFDLGFRIQRLERVRLADVNTPEVRGADKARGKLAKARVQALCPVGSVVKVQTGKAGKFNRYVAHVQVDGVGDLGELLVAEGHAALYGS